MEEQNVHKKQPIVDEIKEQIQNAQSVVVVEYTGLTVQEVTQLRNDYRNAGVDYKVYKNTMVNLALKDLGYEGYEEILNGPNAFVFSNEDMVQGPKITDKFSAQHEAKFNIKAGFMDGNVMTADEVVQLSKLPSKEELLAQVLRALQGPISGLANVCQGTIRSAVYALNAVKEKKQEEEAA